MNKLPEEAAFSPQGVISGFEEAAMNKDDVAGLVERLDAATKDDHERGCQGRYYACSCGHDDSNAQLLQDSKDALTTLSARVETLEAALENLIAHCHEQERILTEDLHHTDFCGESIVLLGARQALAGDTNHG